MRIIDFKNLTVTTEIEYKNIQFLFELSDKLDMPFIKFAKLIQQDLRDKIQAANLEQYKDSNLVIEFRTDLKSNDLDGMIPRLLTAFVLGLDLDKSTWKHGEKRLTVPQNMLIDKGYLLDANALDLINYNLPVERINFLFYNKKGQAIRSVLV
jgi:hypothetical protein